MTPKIIGNCLMMCIALAFVQLTHPKLFDIEQPPLQQQQNCTPKSKQWKITKHVCDFCSWFDKKCKRLHECSCAMHAKREHERRAKIIRSHARKVAPPSQSRLNVARLVAQVTLVMQAKGCQGVHDDTTPFDTDSKLMGVDNRCSGCMSRDINDFEGPAIPTNWTIKRFAGLRTANASTGTIVWKWLDNKGAEHKFTMPNLHCAPESNVCLLSPQHWAKTQNDNTPIEGTGETTLSHKSTLFWGQRQHKLTMPLGKADNVPTFQAAPGFKRHAAFCADCEIDPKEELETPIEEPKPV